MREDNGHRRQDRQGRVLLLARLEVRGPRDRKARIRGLGHRAGKKRRKVQGRAQGSGHQLARLEPGVGEDSLRAGKRARQDLRVMRKCLTVTRYDVNRVSGTVAAVGNPPHAELSHLRDSGKTAIWPPVVGRPPDSGFPFAFNERRRIATADRPADLRDPLDSHISRSAATF